jgi:hypothetical protein
MAKCGLGHGDDDDVCVWDAVVVWLGWGRVGVELWGDVLVLVGGASLQQNVMTVESEGWSGALRHTVPAPCSACSPQTANSRALLRLSVAPIYKP